VLLCRAVKVMELLKQGFHNFSQGLYDYSHKCAIEVINRKYNIDAYMLAGMSLHKLEKYDDADRYLEIAFKERKEVVAIQLYYLENLKKLMEYNRAIASIEKLETIVPELVSLAVDLYELNGNFAKAIELSYEIKDSIKKHEMLAWNYEKLNNIKAAKVEAKKGLHLDKNSFRLNVTLAKLHIRKSRYKKARNKLKAINKQKLNEVNLSIFYWVKAQCFEGLGHYKKAFKNYTKSNNYLKQTYSYKKLTGKNYYTFDKIHILSHYFKQKPMFDNLIQCQHSITFMVGFPRSGTTLLENMLNAHSQVSTVEEKPLVDDILDYFLKTPKSINKLKTITTEEIINLQKSYIDKRQQFNMKDREVVIDKLPLNLIHIGILYRVFPNAKFIISTRDVRDVSLSCYFQNFALNDAMSYFLDWKTTRKYLDELMLLGMMVVDNYPIKHQIVKYEDFVEEPFEHIKELIKFLGLKWENGLKDYRSKIKGKNINTPSYASVTKKINSQRIQRWKNYEEFFN